MDSTWYNVLVMCLFLVLGSVLNLVVLLLSLLTPSLRTINNEFICHTSAVSLTGCSVLFSISLFEMTSHLLPMTSSTDNLCLAEQIIGILCFSTTSVLLFFFGVYRFMSAVRPLTTLVHVRLNTLRVILLIPWVIAGFVSFLLNVELEGQCQFGDWTNVSQRIFIGFFCLLVAVPVASMLLFFVAIVVKTRENKRKNAEVQVFHEHQIMRSITSSQGGMVIRNPVYDNNLKSNKWEGMGDLTRLSVDGNSKLAEPPNRSTPGVSSRSSDSIFDRLDGNTDDQEQDQLTADSGGEENSENEVKNSQCSDVENDDEITISKNGSSSKNQGWPPTVHSSETETNSDLELDFILPQSEDFLQDMMAALHKSFRASKHSIASRTSIESITFGGSVSSLGSQQHRLPSKPTERSSEKLSKMLIRKKSYSGSHGDSENKTFEGEDSDPSLPGTPTFHPPPPPAPSSPPPRKRSSSTTGSGDIYTQPARPTSLQLSPQSGTSSTTTSDSGGHDPNHECSTTSTRPGPPSQLVPGSGKPPPLPTRPPPVDRPPPLPSQPPPGDSPLQSAPGPGYLPPLPCRPPPGETLPTRPSCPVPGSSRDHHSSGSSSQYTDSFQKTDSEGEERNPKAGDQEPIDKWLLERIRTIESSKLESTIPSPGNTLENGSTVPVMPTTATRNNGESFSEGYSTNVLLLIYTILFVIFQVPHTVMTLHTILSLPGPAVEVPLRSTISYTLHLVYYTLTPVVTLSICKPLKTVLYNRAVQMGVSCVDSVVWCKEFSFSRDTSSVDPGQR